MFVISAVVRGSPHAEKLFTLSTETGRLTQQVSETLNETAAAKQQLLLQEEELLEKDKRICLLEHNIVTSNSALQLKNDKLWEQEDTCQRLLERKDTMSSEMKRLRTEAYSVDLYDVDAGITETVQGSDEPAAKRIQREQVAGARLSAALQERLVKVKAEKTEAEEEAEYEIQEKSYQIRATNSLQTKVDEMRTLALAASADASAIKAIFDRPL